jgi:hypothetical protein
MWSYQEPFKIQLYPNIVLASRSDVMQALSENVAANGETISELLRDSTGTFHRLL